MAEVAFIGLGTMGYPMAGHLATAGHRVRVHNRTGATAERWRQRYGGTVAPEPVAAAAGAEAVFVCVGGDPDVREVVLGPSGALAGMAPGSVLVDHTTASDELARELAALAGDRGVGFVDAPVSGGQSGAERGALSIMCGGAPEHLDAVRPLLRTYGTTVTHLGPAGSGQLTKMVNQILCAAAIQGAAEALAFGMRAGLDMDRLLDAVTGGAASSWYLEHRGHTMVRDEFEFGFATEWMLKDLLLCLGAGARVGAPLPLTEAVAQGYRELVAGGAGRLDATVLIRLLRDAGGDRPPAGQDDPGPEPPGPPATAP